MKKFWTIFKHEYTRHVLRRRFIFALLSVPLWFAFTIGIALLGVAMQSDTSPVGYVDQAQFIQQLESPLLEYSPITRVSFQAYSSEEAARAALEADDIQAYYVLPPDYQQTRRVNLVYFEQPESSVKSQFRDLLRINLLTDLPEDVTQRIIDGPELVIEATQEDRQVAQTEWIKIAAPVVAGIFLIVSIFTSSGYLMQAVVEEKENRTMEILATSLSPEQIMGGKIIALICVGLTQVFLWALVPVVFLGFAVTYFPFLQGVTFDWRLIGLTFLTALPTFLLVAALMATIGATVTESREGQQISSLVTLPVMAPFMLMTPIMMNPGGPVALVLTFFPLTTCLTLLSRIAFGSVPTWQIVLSTAVLILSAAGALWFAGRVFRLGMLQYGRRLGWKDLWGVIRPGQTAPPTIGREGAR